MKKLKIKNCLNNNFNSTHPTPLHQCAVNEALTSLFCLLAFLFLYACGTASIDSPTPPSTTTHKVTFNPNTPSATSATVSNLPAEQKVNEGNFATVPTTLPTLSGYTFDGWYTDANAITAFLFSTNITKATTLYAKWTPLQTFTITYHGNKPSDAPADVNVTGVPENPLSISAGQTATVPTPPTFTGYDFAEWYTEEAATNTYDFSQVITANIDLYAKWTIQGFTVTYHANKPSDAPQDATVTGVPATPTNVNYNQTTTAPTPPTLTGYNFVAWYTEEATTNQFDFSQVITANIDLYAKWTIQGFTVTYHANKPSDAPQDATVTGVPAIPTNVNYNQTITAPTPPTLTGYNFVAWYTEEAATNVFRFSTLINTNIDLYAKWTAKPTFTVSYNANKPTSATANVEGMPTDVKVIINLATSEPSPEPTLVGYTFEGWYTEEAATNVFRFSTLINTNIDLYAKWTAKPTFTVSYNANKPTSATANVEGMPTDVNVIINLATTEPSPEPTLVGYTFEGWYTEQATTTAFDFTRTITVNIDLYAKWTAKPTFTVSYNANKPTGAVDNVMGVPTDVKVIINLATTEPSPEPTLVGYTFEGWYTEPTTTTAFDFTRTITVNIDLYAKWAIQVFTVTYNVNKPSGATATNVAGMPDSVMINYNLATAEPSSEPTLGRYTFEGWYTEQAATTKFVFTTPITEDKTLYAKWVFRPSTKDELLAEINRAITTATPSPNLNYIDTSLIDDMSELFEDKSSFNGNISEWNVSKVENMFKMFTAATVFNGDISSWNVSLVENMSQMFYGASAFNQNISSWNVSLVEKMNGMFIVAGAFNSNISSWNVSNVNDMNFMFSGTTSFNQNISSWNVSRVEDMNSMFQGATAFNQNLSSWNVSRVKIMISMFSFASVFNGNISSWNVAKVTNMNNMFSNASAFNQNISSWDVAKVTNMNNMFRGATVFNGNISSWDVAKVTNMNNMFRGATVFNGNISSWDVAKVTNMNNMFNGAWVFNQNISNWNVSKVTDMSNMFEDATAFNQNISNWNVVMVTKFVGFRDASALSDANTPEKFR